MLKAGFINNIVQAKSHQLVAPTTQHHQTPPQLFNIPKNNVYFNYTSFIKNNCFKIYLSSILLLLIHYPKMMTLPLDKSTHMLFLFWYGDFSYSFNERMIIKNTNN